MIDQTIQSLDPKLLAEFDPDLPAFRKWAAAVVEDCERDQRDAAPVLNKAMAAAIDRRSPDHYAPEWDLKGREIYDKHHGADKGESE